MARVDSAYDYYVSTYVNKEVSRYDSHNKNDLRRISNRIIKENKESPLYKIPNMDSAKKYAIDIKEDAKSLLNVVASLSDKYGSFEDSFQKKVAVSSANDKVDVTYIGDGSEENKTEGFQIEVQELAAPQVNTGNFLPDDELAFRPGSYSFDLNTNSAAYEFQYNVNEDETNLDIMKKLARLVNTSNLGITAEIQSDGKGASALALTSVQTGLSSNEDSLFSIYPSAGSGSVETMDTLGIDHVTQQAHNSSFKLNGTSHESLSNTFTINNVFELKLKDVTGEEGATISFKPNTDAIADNIQTLVDAYNDILHMASDKAASNSAADNRLYRDMASVSRGQQTSLENIGLMVQDDATVSIDRSILADAVSPDRAADTFQTLSRFRDTIGEKAQSVSINPMNYVNKVIVAYKNPGHNFATPYISSIYSGMMLDNYV
jgi:flagellar hook-associated protein 2